MTFAKAALESDTGHLGMTSAKAALVTFLFLKLLNFCFPCVAMIC